MIKQRELKLNSTEQIENYVSKDTFLIYLIGF